MYVSVYVCMFKFVWTLCRQVQTQARHAMSDIQMSEFFDHSPPYSLERVSEFIWKFTFGARLAD